MGRQGTGVAIMVRLSAHPLIRGNRSRQNPDSREFWPSGRHRERKREGRERQGKGERERTGNWCLKAVFTRKPIVLLFDETFAAEFPDVDHPPV